MTVGLAALNASALGLGDFNLSGIAALNIMHVDQALDFVSMQRASVGGSLSRLDSIANTLLARSENLTASRSRIRDADYAAETATLTKTMILQQAATSMIAQANASPQTVMSLLR
jgi:flagellin